MSVRYGRGAFHLVIRHDASFFHDWQHSRVGVPNVWIAAASRVAWGSSIDTACRSGQKIEPNLKWRAGLELRNPRADAFAVLEIIGVLTLPSVAAILDSGVRRRVKSYVYIRFLCRGNVDGRAGRNPDGLAGCLSGSAPTVGRDVRRVRRHRRSVRVARNTFQGPSTQVRWSCSNA